MEISFSDNKIRFEVRSSQNTLAYIRVHVSYKATEGKSESKSESEKETFCTHPQCRSDTIHI